jgi:OFA family oxalate/formate antiporter-like MFS transporter
MPSLTADFFGAKSVGANYGMLFSAWGLCGFLVPGYFAGILDRAKSANRVAEGYSEVFLTLAVLAVAGAAAGALLKPPKAA